MLVTGCAGFVGSHLAERLVADGATVTGLDSFSDYYERDLKERNVAALRDLPGFELVEDDLALADLEPRLEGVDTVFHFAAQPGVRGSWGPQFELYTRNNVIATQRLLEGAVAAGVRRVVLASSSSVYGDAAAHPTPEDAVPQPISPYGVTKVAAEHLAQLYRSRFGLESVVLRLFTVYGPRQRPDMAFARFARALERGEPLVVYGDGEQSRDFTYVADAVDAAVLAATAEGAEGVYNVGGGSVCRLREAIALLAEAAEQPARVEHREAAPGDVRDTSADTSRARGELGFAPRVGLAEGLRRQLEWVRDGGPDLAPTEVSRAVT